MGRQVCADWARVFPLFRERLNLHHPWSRAVLFGSVGLPCVTSLFSIWTVGHHVSNAMQLWRPHLCLGSSWTTHQGATSSQASIAPLFGYCKLDDLMNSAGFMFSTCKVGCEQNFPECTSPAGSSKCAGLKAIAITIPTKSIQCAFIFIVFLPCLFVL